MTKQISGELVYNPYGNWEDVDKGWYLKTDYGIFDLDEFLQIFKNKVVTIEVRELLSIQDQKD